MKDVVRNSLPVVGAMLSGLIMMMVDRICLARYSESTLAASGPAVFTAMAIITFFTGATAIVRTFVGQANGQKSPSAIASSSAAGLVLATVLGCALLALQPLMAGIPGLSHRAPAIVELERQYLSIAPFFGFFMVLNTASASIFNGLLKTRIPLGVTAVGQAVNVFFTVGLVFGKFGLPEMGMRGSALGTLGASALSSAIYAVLLQREGLLPNISRRSVRELLPLIKKQWRLGAPAGLTASLEEAGQTVFVWLVGGISTLAMMVNNIALSVNYLAIIPIIGVGIGCSVLVANKVGERDERGAMQAVFAALAVASIYVGAMVAVQQIFPDAIIGLFLNSSSDSTMAFEARAVVKVLWTYAATFMVSMILGSALEAKGLSRQVFWIRLVFAWGLSLPIVGWISHSAGGKVDSVVTCWLVGSVFELVIAACYAILLYKRREVSGDVFGS